MSVVLGGLTKRKETSFTVKFGRFFGLTMNDWTYSEKFNVEGYECSFGIQPQVSGGLLQLVFVDNTIKMSSDVYCVKNDRDVRLGELVPNQALYWAMHRTNLEGNGWVRNDEIVIRVNLTIYSPRQGDFPLPSEEKTLIKDLTAMLNEGKKSDVSIKVGEVTIPAHKCILCLRSEVFQGMFDSNMVEASTNIVEITDFDSSVVKELLAYMYTDTCKVDVHPEQLLAISCKYQVLGLTAVCENYLSSTLTIDNVFKLLHLAECYGANYLEKAALRFIQANGKKLVESEQFFSEVNNDSFKKMVKALVGL